MFNLFKIYNHVYTCKHLMYAFYEHVTFRQFHRNRCGVVDKPLVLYPEVLSVIPGSSSLLDETKPWSHFSMALAVGGILNTNSLNHLSSFIHFRCQKLTF